MDDPDREKRIMMYTDRANDADSDTQRTASDSMVAQLDHEMMDMCRRKGLFDYIESVDGIIRETYRGVVNITHTRIEYLDPAGHEELCFEIHLRSNTAQIIEDERKLYDAFFDLVPREKRELFTFTHRVL